LGPLFISATVEASNFKCGIQLALGEELAKKQLLRPKLESVHARGASKKFGGWYPLFISATIEACKLKFGTQVGLGE